MFSALKHQGTPLYRLARQGIEIERKEREINISMLQLDAFDGRYFDLTVVCSKGTYIRNLIEDIGSALGVGAHMTALHRVYTAGFEGMAMYTLDELALLSHEQKISCLVPMDKAVSYLHPVTVSTEEVLALRQGKLITLKTQLPVSAEQVRLYSEGKSLSVWVNHLMMDL